MFLLRCSECRQSLRVSGKAAGHSVACPKCRHAVAVPATLVEHPPRWYYWKNRELFGPVTWDGLRALAGSGEIDANDYVQKEGLADWQRAGQMLGLFPMDGSPSPARRRRTRRWVTAALGVAAAGLVGVLALPAFQPQIERLPRSPRFPTEFAFAAPVAAAPGAVEEEAPQTVVSFYPSGSLDEAPAETLTVMPRKLGPSAQIANVTPATKAAPPASPASQAAAAVVSRINVARRAAGLAPVTLAPSLCNGCQAHADYLGRNADHPMLAAPGAIQEQNPSLPGYGEEGRQAAQASMIAFADPNLAADLWLGKLATRMPLLHPELHKVGVGFSRSPRGDWVTVLDPARGRTGEAVVFPGPNQEQVPLAFSGGPEGAPSAGFPVSISFAPDRAVANAQFDLLDVNGNRISAATSTPESPLPKVRANGFVGLLPSQNLLGNTTYKVQFSALVDGRPTKREWTFRTEDEEDSDGLWATRTLAKLNQLRASAGLPPVVLDTSLSKGCRQHAKYLALNARHQATQGLNAHQEDPRLPGATTEGAKAGRASDIAIGDYEPIDALDGWMATLYHRVPLLEPSLAKIGFGCARGERLGWITVLDVASGRGGPAKADALAYPVDGQTQVPLIFPPGGEEPNPIPDDKDGKAGYPITLSFPAGNPLTQARATLETSRGEPVSCWFSSPESVANPRFVKHQGTTVCLIPHDPLRPETTYRVNVSGRRAGSPWTKSWSFTTGSAGVSSQIAASAVLERINRIRRNAGADPIDLDADLSKGCRLHAEYLVRHAGLRDQPSFPVDDEMPEHEGYTHEGRAAARNSEIFTQSPRPEVQIDDLIGTLTRRDLLLDPKLRKIGFGCAMELGRGWVNVLDVHRGRVDDAPILFPAANQKDVQCRGHDVVPNGAKAGIGFPVTVTFAPRQVVRRAHASLIDTNGENVDVWLSSPERPFAPGMPVNAICIHPLTALTPGQWYGVTVQAEVDGREWRQTWSFTTGTR